MLPISVASLDIIGPQQMIRASMKYLKALNDWRSSVCTIPLIH